MRGIVLDEPNDHQRPQTEWPLREDEALVFLLVFVQFRAEADSHCGQIHSHVMLGHGLRQRQTVGGTGKPADDALMITHAVAARVAHRGFGHREPQPSLVARLRQAANLGGDRELVAGSRRGQLQRCPGWRVEKRID